MTQDNPINILIACENKKVSTLVDAFNAHEAYRIHLNATLKIPFLYKT